MLGIAPAPKTAASLEEATFTAAFYAPYAQAAAQALTLLCAARAQMPARDAVRRITYRLKTPASIREKLQKRGLPATISAAASLHDVAGLRVVLSNEAQVYAFAERIKALCASEFSYARDYIASPKPSGYRSLHLILRMPVSRRRSVPVEIQLRTCAMDDWAAVEHDACYKPAARRATPCAMGKSAL